MPSQENERLHEANERLLELAMASESGRAAAVGPATGPALAFAAPALPELQGSLGHYRLVRPLGHGGQGIVYLAEDTRLSRQVALKLLSAGGAAAPTTCARFEREATAASRLRHPGICTVFDAGEIDGQRFLAMEFVDGESLTAWIARTTATGSSSESTQGRARVDRALELTEQIARAVHAAHEAGVVHRDLKPQNIMLRRDGSPVVLDFGLARDDTQDGAVLTMQGDVLGTPAYMPPERVRGTAGTVGHADPREDVYGLGAILYECLTGQRPFRGHTREQLYQRILTASVDDPRRSDRAIPREARFVTETAMEKVPDRRYATALDFAEDVRRLRQREPIQARPVPAWLRLQRWVQRHPGAAIPTIVAFVVLVAGVITAFVLLGRVGAESRQTRIRALLAESTLEVGRDPQRALLLARAASQQLDQAATEELRTTARSQLIEVLAQSHRVRDFEHRDNMVGVGFSPDGTRLVSVASGRTGPAMRSWQIDGDAEPIAAHRSESAGDRIIACAFDAGQPRVLLVPSRGMARIVSLTDGSLLHDLGSATDGSASMSFAVFERPHSSLSCFVPGREGLVLTGSRDGARLWQLTGGELYGREVWHDLRPQWQVNQGVCQLAVAADGGLCAAGEQDGTLRVLDVSSGSLFGQSRAHSHLVFGLAFDPQRKLLASIAEGEQRVLVWRTDEAATAPGDVPPLLAVGELTIDGRAPKSMVFAPSAAGQQSVLLVFDTDRAIHLFRGTEAPPWFERYATVRTHHSALNCAAFSPDGSRFVTGSNDGIARVFDLGGRQLDKLAGGESAIIAATWSPDGRYIATADALGPARLWRTRDATFRVENVPHEVGALAAAGDRVAAALRDGSIAVVDLDGAPTRLASRPPSGTVTSGLVTMAMQPDGHRLAVGGRPGWLDLWGLRTGTPKLEPAVAGLASALEGDKLLGFRDDGSLFVVAGSKAWALRANGRVESIADLTSLASVAVTDGAVALIGSNFAMWDCERGVVDAEKVLDIGRPNEFPYATTSADGRRIALWQWQTGILRIVDAQQRRVHREFSLPMTRSAALNANGTQLLTGAVNGQVRLWDLTADPPRLIVELRGHLGTVWGVCFSPDGRQLITGASDGAIRFWPAQFDDLDGLVEARLVRDWTDLERARYAGLIGR